MELVFRAGPSYLLAALSSVLHLSAMMAIVVSAMPSNVKLLMMLLLSVNGFAQLRRATLRAGSAPTAVYVDDSGLLLELGSRRRVPVTISTVYCTSWLQVVGFHRRMDKPGLTYWLAVLPGSADPAARRWLRAWLLAGAAGLQKYND